MIFFVFHKGGWTRHAINNNECKIHSKTPSKIDDLHKRGGTFRINAYDYSL